MSPNNTKSEPTASLAIKALESDRMRLFSAQSSFARIRCLSNNRCETGTL